MCASELICAVCRRRKATFLTKVEGNSSNQFTCEAHRPILTESDDGTQEYNPEGWSVESVLDSWQEDGEMSRLRSMFRKIGNAWYFDGHRFSLMHGMVKLNEPGEEALGVRE